MLLIYRQQHSPPVSPQNEPLALTAKQTPAKPKRGSSQKPTTRKMTRSQTSTASHAHDTLHPLCATQARIRVTRLLKKATPVQKAATTLAEMRRALTGRAAHDTTLNDVARAATCSSPREGTIPSSKVATPPTPSARKEYNLLAGSRPSTAQQGTDAAGDVCQNLLTLLPRATAETGSNVTMAQFLRKENHVAQPILQTVAAVMSGDTVQIEALATEQDTQQDTKPLEAVRTEQSAQVLAGSRLREPGTGLRSKLYSSRLQKTVTLAASKTVGGDKEVKPDIALHQGEPNHNESQVYSSQRNGGAGAKFGKKLREQQAKLQTVDLPTAPTAPARSPESTERLLLNDSDIDTLQKLPNGSILFVSIQDHWDKGFGAKRVIEVSQQPSAQRLMDYCPGGRFHKRVSKDNPLVQHARVPGGAVVQVQIWRFGASACFELLPGVDVDNSCLLLLWRSEFDGALLNVGQINQSPLANRLLQCADFEQLLPSWAQSEPRRLIGVKLRSVCELHSSTRGGRSQQAGGQVGAAKTQSGVAGRNVTQGKLKLQCQKVEIVPLTAKDNTRVKFLEPVGKADGQSRSQLWRIIKIKKRKVVENHPGDHNKRLKAFAERDVPLRQCGIDGEIKPRGKETQHVHGSNGDQGPVTRLCCRKLEETVPSMALHASLSSIDAAAVGCKCPDDDVRLKSITFDDVIAFRVLTGYTADRKDLRFSRHVFPKVESYRGKLKHGILSRGRVVPLDFHPADSATRWRLSSSHTSSLGLEPMHMLLITRCTGASQELMNVWHIDVLSLERAQQVMRELGMDKRMEFRFQLRKLKALEDYVDRSQQQAQVGDEEGNQCGDDKATDDVGCQKDTKGSREAVAQQSPSQRQPPQRVGQPLLAAISRAVRAQQPHYPRRPPVSPTLPRPPQNAPDCPSMRQPWLLPPKPQQPLHAHGKLQPGQGSRLQDCSPTLLPLPLRLVRHKPLQEQSQARHGPCQQVTPTEQLPQPHSLPALVQSGVSPVPESPQAAKQHCDNAKRATIRAAAKGQTPGQDVPSNAPQKRIMTPKLAGNLPPSSQAEPGKPELWIRSDNNSGEDPQHIVIAPNEALQWDLSPSAQQGTPKSPSENVQDNPIPAAIQASLTAPQGTGLRSAHHEQMAEPELWSMQSQQLVTMEQSPEHALEQPHRLRSAGNNQSGVGTGSAGLQQPVPACFQEASLQRAGGSKSAVWDGRPHHLAPRCGSRHVGVNVPTTRAGSLPILLQPDGTLRHVPITDMTSAHERLSDRHNTSPPACGSLSQVNVVLVGEDEAGQTQHQLNGQERVLPLANGSLEPASKGAQRGLTDHAIQPRNTCPTLLLDAPGPSRVGMLCDAAVDTCGPSNTVAGLSLGPVVPQCDVQLGDSQLHHQLGSGQSSASHDVAKLEGFPIAGSLVADALANDEGGHCEADEGGKVQHIEGGNNERLGDMSATQEAVQQGGCAGDEELPDGTNEWLDCKEEEAFHNDPRLLQFAMEMGLQLSLKVPAVNERVLYLLRLARRHDMTGVLAQLDNNWSQLLNSQPRESAVQMLLDGSNAYVAQNLAGRDRFSRNRFFLAGYAEAQAIADVATEIGLQQTKTAVNAVISWLERKMRWSQANSGPVSHAANQ